MYARSRCTLPKKTTQILITNLETRPSNPLLFLYPRWFQTSYHLRQQSAFGRVEEDGGGRHQEPTKTEPKPAKVPKRKQVNSQMKELRALWTRFDGLKCNIIQTERKVRLYGPLVPKTNPAEGPTEKAKVRRRRKRREQIEKLLAIGNRLRIVENWIQSVQTKIQSLDSGWTKREALKEIVGQRLRTRILHSYDGDKVPEEEKAFIANVFRQTATSKTIFRHVASNKATLRKSYTSVEKQTKTLKRLIMRNRHDPSRMEWTAAAAILMKAMSSGKQRRGVTLLLKEEAILDLTGSSAENLWIHGVREGCEVEVLARTSLAEPRRLFLRGSPRAIELTKEYLLAYEPQISKLDEMNKPLEGGLRFVLSKSNLQLNPESAIRVDEVPRPAQWTIRSFADYIQELVMTRLTRGSKRDLYVSGETHNETQAALLEGLFADPAIEPFISSRALNIAMTFLSFHTQHFSSLRQLYARSKALGLNMQIGTYNIMFESALKSNDIEYFAELVTDMSTNGVVPDGTSWSKLLKIVRSSLARRELLQFILRNYPQEAYDPSNQLIERLIDVEFPRMMALGLGGLNTFVERLDNAFSSSWLGHRSLNRILYVCAEGMFSQAADDIVKLARSRNVALSHGTVTYLLRMSRKERNVQKGIRIVQSCFENGTPYEHTLVVPSMFMLAWKSKYYNVCKVLWHYAATYGIITYKMQAVVNSSLIDNAYDEDSGRRWQHAAGKIIAGTDLGVTHFDTQFPLLTKIFCSHDPRDLLAQWTPDDGTRDEQLSLAYVILHRDLDAWKKYRKMLPSYFHQLLAAAFDLDKDWQIKGVHSQGSLRELMSFSIKIKLIPNYDYLHNDAFRPGKDMKINSQLGKSTSERMVNNIENTLWSPNPNSNLRLGTHNRSGSTRALQSPSSASKISSIWSSSPNSLQPRPFSNPYGHNSPSLVASYHSNCLPRGRWHAYNMNFERNACKIWYLSPKVGARWFTSSFASHKDSSRNPVQSQPTVTGNFDPTSSGPDKTYEAVFDDSAVDMKHHCVKVTNDMQVSVEERLHNLRFKMQSLNHDLRDAEDEAAKSIGMDDIRNHPETAMHDVVFDDSVVDAEYLHDEKSVPLHVPVEERLQNLRLKMLSFSHVLRDAENEVAESVSLDDIDHDPDKTNLGVTLSNIHPDVDESTLLDIIYSKDLPKPIDIHVRSNSDSALQFAFMDFSNLDQATQVRDALSLMQIGENQIQAKLAAPRRSTMELRVYNLPRSLTPEEVGDILSNPSLPRSEKWTRFSWDAPYTAFATYPSEEDAAIAAQALQGMMVYGQRIYVRKGYSLFPTARESPQFDRFLRTLDVKEILELGFRPDRVVFKETSGKSKTELKKTLPTYFGTELKYEMKEMGLPAPRKIKPFGTEPCPYVIFATNYSSADDAKTVLRALQSLQIGQHTLRVSYLRLATSVPSVYNVPTGPNMLKDSKVPYVWTMNHEIEDILHNLSMSTLESLGFLPNFLIIRIWPRCRDPGELDELFVKLNIWPALHSKLSALPPNEGFMYAGYRTVSETRKVVKILHGLRVGGHRNRQVRVTYAKLNDPMNTVWIDEDAIRAAAEENGIRIWKSTPISDARSRKFRVGYVSSRSRCVLVDGGEDDGKESTEQEPSSLDAGDGVNSRQGKPRVRFITADPRNSDSTATHRLLGRTLSGNPYDIPRSYPPYTET